MFLKGIFTVINIIGGHCMFREKNNVAEVSPVASTLHCFIHEIDISNLNFPRAVNGIISG